MQISLYVINKSSSFFKLLWLFLFLERKSILHVSPSHTVLKIKFSLIKRKQKFSHFADKEQANLQEPAKNDVIFSYIKKTFSHNLYNVSNLEYLNR